jgi:hypothetical protein
MAAAIMCNATVPARRQKKHLILERICAQGPAMTENNRLPHAPVLKINLRPIFRRKRAHEFSFCCFVVYKNYFPPPNECQKLKTSPP